MAATTRLNAFLLMPDTLSAEIMGRAGWDILTIDMQHGAIGPREAFVQLQVLSAMPVEPWVRVPALAPGVIQRMLDAGATGIVCPMMEHPAEVRQLVAACRYPPDGRRSFGPIRPMLTEGLAYGTSANGRVRPIAMIETEAALDEIEAIAAVPGLWGVYVGPTDLGLALGLPAGGDRDDPVFLDALDRIVAAATSHGVAVCMHATGLSYARRMADRGFAVLTAGSDYDLLGEAARTRVAAFGTADKVTPSQVAASS